MYVYVHVHVCANVSNSDRLMYCQLDSIIALNGIGILVLEYFYCVFFFIIIQVVV